MYRVDASSSWAQTLICPAAVPRSQSAPLLLPRHTSPSSPNPTTVASRDYLMYTWRTVRVISGLNSQPLTVISPLELQQTHMDFTTPGTSSGGPPGPAPGTRSGCWYHEHVGPCDTQPTPVATPWSHRPCDLWSGCYIHTMHNHTCRIVFLTQEKR